MHIFKLWSHRVISLVVSAALFLAPVLPMAASAGGEAEHAAHESIGDMGAAQNDADAPQTEHGKAAGAKTSSCDQHDQCSEKCCAAHAQCFTAAVYNHHPAFLLTNALLSPTVPHLNDRLTVASHLRPPAA